MNRQFVVALLGALLVSSVMPAAAAEREP